MEVGCGSSSGEWGNPQLSSRDCTVIANAAPVPDSGELAPLSSIAAFLTCAKPIAQHDPAGIDRRRAGLVPEGIGWSRHDTPGPNAAIPISMELPSQGISRTVRNRGGPPHRPNTRSLSPALPHALGERTEANNRQIRIGPPQSPPFPVPQMRLVAVAGGIGPAISLRVCNVEVTGEVVARVLSCCGSTMRILIVEDEAKEACASTKDLIEPRCKFSVALSGLA
jgi:hypothetical protein